MTDALLVAPQPAGPEWLPQLSPTLLGLRKTAGSSARGLYQAYGGTWAVFPLNARAQPAPVPSLVWLEVDQTLGGHNSPLESRMTETLRASEAATFVPPAKIEDRNTPTRTVLEQLKRVCRREQEEKRFRLETKWIAENRHKHLGRWIALEGDQLLAEGSTSREVFSKVSDRPDPPLVFRIEEVDLPFGGW